MKKEREKKVVLYRRVFPSHVDPRPGVEKGLFDQCKSYGDGWLKKDDVRVGGVINCPNECGTKFLVKALIPPAKGEEDGRVQLVIQFKQD